MSQRILLSLITFVILTLSACQPTKPFTPAEPDISAETQAIEALNSGDYLLAAHTYLELASATTGQQQAGYYLHAAQAFWQINQVDQATESLASINRDLLNSVLHADIATLEATIALSQYLPEQALVSLTNVNIDILKESQQRQVLELRINAYNLTQNWLEKANNLIQLSLLLNEFEQQENQQSLWQALTKLTPQALDLFNPGIPPSIDSGWFALAYAVQTYRTNPDALIVAIEDWQRNYPNHPANPELYKKSLLTGTRLPKQLNDIVILLPNSGPFAKAAQAIKQGIIAAHYNAQSDSQLHFFDINFDHQSGENNVWQQYQKAIDIDANLVIGPLDKKAIQVLVDAEHLAIPVLALNRLSNHIQKENLFQFGLAPEDDAVSVANYALEQGFQRAVIIAPNSAWGKRIASAFTEQWSNNGGILLNQATYNASDSDFSTTIKPLLGLEMSKQRSKQLKQILAASLEFEPRRRQDLDFVFLIARPLKARQLVPQLKFHRSGTLPIIATSHAYAGYENSQQDIDLNNLIINDIPWIFSNDALSDPAYMSLYNNKDKQFGQLIRLYALGADSYRLIAELNGLSRSPSLIFQGATGRLSINEYGHIHRDSQWATFKHGKIEALVIDENRP